MRNKPHITPWVVAVMILVWSVFLHAGTRPGVVTVTPVPASVTGLQAGWNWAMASAQKMKDNKGFYIAYSIRRMMGQNSFIGCYSDDKTDSRLTLNEIIYGQKLPASNYSSFKDKSVGDVARDVLKHAKAVKAEAPEKKVAKDVVVLFRFHAGKSLCHRILASNIEMAQPLEEGPLMWLGAVRDEESIPFLQHLYQQFSPSQSPAVSALIKLKEALIMAVSLHDKAGLAFPFLKAVLTGNEPVEVREKAAFWIGESQYPQGVPLLAATAVSDKSPKVREQAVFGLYLMHLATANDALIDLAKSGKDIEVRKHAIFWLGQKAIKQSAQVLAGVVDSPADKDVQEAAVFALSQLPANQGVSSLIHIAKTHKSLAIRKKAIFWLSQSDDSKALDAIVSMIQK